MKADVEALLESITTAAQNGATAGTIDERLIEPSSATASQKVALRLYLCSYFSRRDLREEATGRLRRFPGPSPGNA